MLILTHTDRQSVQIAVERIRKQLESHKFHFDRREASVTASFGIAGLQEINGRNLASLVRAADLALYSAERKGRNRIEFQLVDSISCQVKPQPECDQQRACHLDRHFLPSFTVSTVAFETTSAKYPGRYPCPDMSLWTVRRDHAVARIMQRNPILPW